MVRWLRHKSSGFTRAAIYRAIERLTFDTRGDLDHQQALTGVRQISGKPSFPHFFGAIIYMSIYSPAMKTHTTPQSILKQIAKIERMEPGKLCVIGQGPNGPYHNLQCREGGKTRTRYVPAEQVAVVAEHTANYRQFQSLTEEYAAVVIAQTRAEREAGLKKKTRPPTSSSPKTRKSRS